MSKYIKKFSSDFIDLSQEDIPILEVLIIELSLGSCTGIKENLSNMLNKKMDLIFLNLNFLRPMGKI